LFTLFLAAISTAAALTAWARYGPFELLTLALLALSLFAWIRTGAPGNRRRIENFVSRVFGWDIGPYG
jgi:uncharacterized membrane protein YfcA